MGLLQALAQWFADPAHWQGPDGIPTRVAEHIQISLLSVVVATLLALPAGFFVGHTGRGAFATISLANVGRAVPSFALMSMIFPIGAAFFAGTQYIGFGFEFLPTFLAMTLLAIPPILTNTYVGVREVDRELVEAARGMGMRGLEILRRVEIPLALPVVLAGLRTAAVQVVATATLGAVLGLGGLGRYIIDGIASRENAQLLAGVVLVALLALVTESAFAVLQRRATSPGLRSERIAGRRPAWVGPGQAPAPVGPGGITGGVTGTS